MLTFINLLYSDVVSYAYTVLPNFLISFFTDGKEKKNYLNKHNQLKLVWFFACLLPKSIFGAF